MKMLLCARLRVSIRFVIIALSVLVPTICFGNVATSCIKPTKVMLSFPLSNGSSVVSNAVISGAGVPAYLFRLVPEIDITNRVIVLDLVLNRLRNRKHGNLLDITGHAMGLQKYTFAASEFQHGAGNSIYGRERTIKLTSSNMKVDIYILQAEVKRYNESPYKKYPFHYEFKNFVVAVQVSNLSKC